jgi:hypothetical protein
MSLVVELMGANEETGGGRSLVLRWILRIVGLATLGGAMWIILWIDNRPIGRTASVSSCDSGSCKCARDSQEGRLRQR